MSVTVTLTAEQAELVTRKSKPYSQRPQIFRPGLGLVTIDDNFEAFLILASTGARSNMALMLNVLLQYTLSPSTRQAAYREMVTDQLVDAKYRQAQATQILGSFESSFQGLDPGPFLTVPSVQQMHDDLKAVLGSLNSFQDAANYQFALSFVYTRQLPETSSTEYDQMIRSYYTALVAYM